MTVLLKHKLTGVKRFEKNVTEVFEDDHYIKLKYDPSQSIIAGTAIDKRYAELVQVYED